MAQRQQYVERYLCQQFQLHFLTELKHQPEVEGPEMFCVGKEILVNQLEQKLQLLSAVEITLEAQSYNNVAWIGPELITWECLAR